MPTLASATAIIHLYRPPTSGSEDGKTWAMFNGWTSDKVKPEGGGDAEKKFTSFKGFVNGPQAEWLARDGVKGSMVAVTGTIRVDTHTKDNKTSAFIEFTRVTECRILDSEREDQPAQDPMQRLAEIGRLHATVGPRVPRVEKYDPANDETVPF